MSIIINRLSFVQMKNPINSNSNVFRQLLTINCIIIIIILIILIIIIIIIIIITNLSQCCGCLRFADQPKLLFFTLGIQTFVLP